VRGHRAALANYGGARSACMDKKIQRFSEITGDEDKLTCATMPNAQAEVLELLTSI
jgi:hypothetical protein